MNSDQLVIVQRVMDAVFGPGAVPARLDGEQIVVDAFTISVGEVEQASILGTTKVPGYVLDVGVPTPGGRDEPPGVDVVEMAADKSLPAVVLALAANVAVMRANAMLDRMATDAWVEEYERDKCEAKEYWSASDYTLDG